MDLRAKPDRAATDGAGALMEPARLKQMWERDAKQGRDAHAMCCLGIHCALTGDWGPARAWRERAAARMAQGPGLVAVRVPDAEYGLLDPRVDGLYLD